MKIIRIFIVCAAVVLSGLVAQQTVQAGFFGKSEEAPPSQSPDVRKVEAYLQGLKTVRAKFKQTAHNSELTGTFFLKRPGKLRFEYDQLEDFVVADGFFIYFYDAELQEQSNAPIGQTLADFLLRPGIRLYGDVTITEVKRGGGLLQVSLVQTADPQAGSLILGFEEQGAARNLLLKKWRVIDAIGNVTEVELFEIQSGLKLPGSLFVYQNPNRFEDNRYND